mmetsp:Transcript_6910/g.25774  ORF Transcript_6910/g.25774 Transcript_6910/m.25774 type:complete len:152 (-) Transcript_6910:1354-1809(-)
MWLIFWRRDIGVVCWSDGGADVGEDGSKQDLAELACLHTKPSRNNSLCLFGCLSEQQKSGKPFPAKSNHIIIIINLNSAWSGHTTPQYHPLPSPPGQVTPPPLFFSPSSYTHTHPTHNPSPCKIQIPTIIPTSSTFYSSKMTSTTLERRRI